MRVSLNWLKELLPDGALADISIDTLTHQLDMTGTAVEGVQMTGAHLEGIYVGQIVVKKPHPDSDHLWVTRVDVGAIGAQKGAGEDGLLQIICGAQNFEVGDKVPVATVGTVFDDEGKNFVIKKSKLRGIESCGMNCSARELGLGADHSGLMILPADAPVGDTFAQYYGLGDTILDLEITPNRPDCLNMVGMAREVGAVFEIEPTNTLISEVGLAQGDEKIDTLATVEVEDTGLCPRYAARVIRGVKIGSSPEWLSQRVVAAGTRSINNVVDVTNFILFEMGQPLHAFDLNTIAKDAKGRAQVVVRRAHTGESITTLDEVARPLDSSNLLIADSSGPITLAGVMGAQATEVESDTTDIFLEAAVFDPANVSRTSRKMALISESSLRFERGVDAEGTLRALDRAAALIVQVAGGTVARGAIDIYPSPVQPCRLVLRLGELTRIVGEDIPLDKAADMLLRLGCQVTSQDKEKLEVTVPTYRPDLEREIDLVEEVLRLWGMERVNATLPAGRQRRGGLTHIQRLRARIEQTFRAAGLNETMTYPFGDVADLEKLGYALGGNERLAELHNPMSSEQASLRVLLLPGLLNSVSLNKRRGVDDVQLYEIGKVFMAREGLKQPKELEMVGAVLSGAWNRPGWNTPAIPLDFFDAKGIVETVVRELCIDRFRMVKPGEGELPWLQPGKGATLMLGGEVAGWLGEVHPLVAHKFDIDDVVVALELDIRRFIKVAKPTRDFVTPPRYPAIEVDIALVVDEDVAHQSIEQRITALGKKSTLESARLFDVYRGKGVPAGKKSMAYRLSYRAEDRTLTSEEVEKAHEKVLARLKQDFGAQLRE